MKFENQTLLSISTEIISDSQALYGVPPVDTHSVSKLIVIFSIIVAFLIGIFAFIRKKTGKK